MNWPDIADYITGAAATVGVGGFLVALRTLVKLARKGVEYIGQLRDDAHDAVTIATAVQDDVREIRKLQQSELDRHNDTRESLAAQASTLSSLSEHVAHLRRQQDDTQRLRAAGNGRDA